MVNDLQAKIEELIAARESLVDDWSKATALAAQVDAENKALREHIYELEQRLEFSGWICEQCRVVYPHRPPTKGLVSVSCPQCGGQTIPKDLEERLAIQRENKALKGRLAALEKPAMALREWWIKQAATINYFGLQYLTATDDLPDEVEFTSLSLALIQELVLALQSAEAAPGQPEGEQRNANVGVQTLNP